jgi:hypothetical protein
MKSLPVLKLIGQELAAKVHQHQRFFSEGQRAYEDGAIDTCVRLLRATLPRCSQFVRASVGAAIRERLNVDGRGL